MTKFEEAFENMIPEQRKRVSSEISEMMGMPPKKKMTPEEEAAYLEQDEILAQQRFIDQPGQWVDITPPEVKENSTKLLVNSSHSLLNSSFDITQSVPALYFPIMNP